MTQSRPIVLPIPLSAQNNVTHRSWVDSNDFTHTTETAILVSANFCIRRCFTFSCKMRYVMECECVVRADGSRYPKEVTLAQTIPGGDVTILFHLLLVGPCLW